MKKQFILRLSEAEKTKLVQQAKEHGRSMNSYIIDLIKRDGNIVQIPVMSQEAYNEYAKNWPKSEIDIQG